MQTFKNNHNNSNIKPYSNFENNAEPETYSYQGNIVKIITVFHDTAQSIAVVEDINTGEQYDVFKEQLY